MICRRVSIFHVESTIKVSFSEAVIAVSVKPRIIIFLDILFKHALLHGALDLDLVPQWHCHNFTSSLAVNGFLSGNDSWECQTA